MRSRLPTLLAALTAAVTGLTAAGALSGLDHAVASRFSGGPKPGLYEVAVVVATLASAPAGAVWGLLLLGLGAARPQFRVPVAVLLSSIALAQLGEVVLKAVVVHPPPHHAGWTVLEVGPGLGLAGSFPSGHVARAVIVGLSPALLAAPRRRRGAVVAGVVFSLAVAWTRVYLGVHWASDVLGGAVTGWFAISVPMAVAGGPSQRLRGRG